MAANVAAFFDLDRTLVSQSSGLLMVDALADAGLLSPRETAVLRAAKPINAAIGRVYSELGETWVWMRLSGGGADRLKRWTIGELRDAARIVSDRLHEAVYAEARALIDWHRREGRLVCVATSTGRELVWPLMAKLGVEHVLATEYAEEDGRLTGEYVGSWLWGEQKAQAVRAFAEGNDVDLSNSWAYSDSFFDRHMLDLVGHPRAVNPDVRLRAYASARGWPVLSFTHAPGAPVLASLEPYDVARVALHPLFTPFRLDVEGLDNIPHEGPVIVASNHRSYLDGLVMAAAISRTGRKPRFLGKREIFDAPVIGQAARVAGQIPVDRGSGSRRPIEEALEALVLGECIVIFPQATIPRGEEFFSSHLAAKTGVARLALQSGAPVVPVGLWGTEQVWPRGRRLPKLTAPLLRPTVHVRVGAPLYLKAPEGRENEKRTLRRLARKVMDEVERLLPIEVLRPPPPSPEQIRAMMPPGAKQAKSRAPTRRRKE